MKLVKMLVVVALVFVLGGVLGIRLAGSGLQADVPQQAAVAQPQIAPEQAVVAQPQAAPQEAAACARSAWWACSRRSVHRA